MVIPRGYITGIPSQKFAEYDIGDLAMDITTSECPVTNLTNISLGTGQGTRTGTGVRIKKMRLVCQIIQSGANVAFSAVHLFRETIRLTLIYDKYPNQSLPTFADVWNVDNNSQIAVIRDDQKERFEILKDKYIDWQSDATWAFTGIATPIFIPYAEKTVILEWKGSRDQTYVFSSTTGDIGAIKYGSFLLFAQGGPNQDIQNKVVSTTTHTWYKDIE